MDSLKPTIDHIIPNADDVERPGDHHTVGRRSVVRKHFKLASDVDMGPVSNEKSFQDMQDLVKEYADIMQTTSERSELLFDENFLQQVANHVNIDFNFTLQGSGISTLPKQLEAYQNFRLRLGERHPTSEEKMNCENCLIAN